MTTRTCPSERVSDEARALRWLRASLIPRDGVATWLASFAAEVRADERAYIAAVMRDVERTQAAERPRDGDRWARVVEMLGEEGER